MKVELRAIEPEDIDVLYKWENDQSIWKVSNTISPFSKHVLTKYIESAHLDIYQSRQLRLMIDLVADNEVKTIGAVDLFDFEPQHLRVGLGILIGEVDERGKGYADESLRILIEYVFNVMKLHQVYCNILTSNAASIKLFEKHGYKLVGVKKEWVKSEHGFEDEAIYQLINTNN